MKRKKQMGSSATPKKSRKRRSMANVEAERLADEIGRRQANLSLTERLRRHEELLKIAKSIRPAREE